jgi:adenine-specific DNA-methyltransferase
MNRIPTTALEQAGTLTGPGLSVDLTVFAEMNRIDSSARIGADRQQELGQFQTSLAIANFMANLIECRATEVSLIDAGAGAGVLCAAAIKHFCEAKTRPRRVSVTAYEVDTTLLHYLNDTLKKCHQSCAEVGIEFTSNVRNQDFIEAGVRSLAGDLFDGDRARFNCAIVNPPYRKIHSGSQTRLLLREAGIETSNLYTGFLSLLVKLLEPKGELVAITPRSFCNGPYFTPFRELLLGEMSLSRLHIFDSRKEAFSDDAVLQENIIFRAVKSQKRRSKVIISTSPGEPNGKVTKRTCKHSDVVSPKDPDLFIHFITDTAAQDVRGEISRFSASLDDLGIAVSTGRVVDFRARDVLRNEPGKDTVPLIYPCHFNNGWITWPRANSRKPNAICDNPRTMDLLVPKGIYVLVKRFSAKEERRRIVANVYDPESIPAERVGFENHLNYFHVGGHGLARELAAGLAAYLNSTLVDAYFRQFNGHTQVNATDLRKMPYPDRRSLERLGMHVGRNSYDQEEIDLLIKTFLLS